MKRLEVEDGVKDVLDEAIVVSERAMRMAAAVHGTDEQILGGASRVLRVALEDYIRSCNARIGVLSDMLLDKQAGI